jgi:integrase
MGVSMDSKLDLEPRRRRPRRKVLTDAMVAALPRHPRRTVFHPDPEMSKFGVRVRPSGPATFTVVMRDTFKRQKWIKIGLSSEMPIADAREKAREVVRRLAAGLEAFEPPKPPADTVAAVAANWLHRHVEKNNLRTADELRRIVDRYITPHIGSRVFVAVNRKQIAELLDYVEDHHGIAQADATLSTLRAISTWVQRRDDTYTPPFVKGMRRVPKQARKRSRILNDAEIQAVWNADGGLFGAFVKLLLLTAQRRDKVFGMKWNDIGDHGVWVIRTEKGEKGNAEAVKLPELALQIIRQQPRFASNPYVFAGRRNGRFYNFAHFKTVFDKTCGVSDWRLHDLRRTARSLMSRAGVQSEIAEKVLGHTVGGVEEIYDRHSYLDEKSEALRKLATLIEFITNPPADNVVPLVRS